MAGFRVWNGFLPGRKTFKAPSLRAKLTPRFCQRIPVSLSTTPEPNSQGMLWIKGIEHSNHRGRGHHVLDGVAALAKHGEAGLGRKVMGRHNHSAHRSGGVQHTSHLGQGIRRWRTASPSEAGWPGSALPLKRQDRQRRSVWTRYPQCELEYRRLRDIPLGGYRDGRYAPAREKELSHHGTTLQCPAEEWDGG